MQNGDCSSSGDDSGDEGVVMVVVCMTVVMVVIQLSVINDGAVRGNWAVSDKVYLPSLLTYFLLLHKGGFVM